MDARRLTRISCIFPIDVPALLEFEIQPCLRILPGNEVCGSDKLDVDVGLFSGWRSGCESQPWSEGEEKSEGQIGRETRKSHQDSFSHSRVRIGGKLAFRGGSRVFCWNSVRCWLRFQKGEQTAILPRGDSLGIANQKGRGNRTGLAGWRSGSGGVFAEDAVVLDALDSCGFGAGYCLVVDDFVLEPEAGDAEADNFVDDFGDCV